MDFLLEMTHFP
nr:unnamed protein product [Callosobruchus analis]